MEPNSIIRFKSIAQADANEDAEQEHEEEGATAAPGISPPRLYFVAPDHPAYAPH